MTETDSWLVWQLADSAFPSGGFAHSGGLEAARQHGAVRDRSSLSHFLSQALAQLGSGALPFVHAAHNTPAQWHALDAWIDAFLNNHVANRASRWQGRAFLKAAGHLQDSPPEALAFPPPCGHFAPVFGAVTRALGLPRLTAARLFVFINLRGWMSAAVRLNLIGPLEAQSLQRSLTPRMEAVLTRHRDTLPEDAAQIAPLPDLWQGNQDRLYSRLFQS